MSHLSPRVPVTPHVAWINNLCTLCKTSPGLLQMAGECFAPDIKPVSLKALSMLFLCSFLPLPHCSCSLTSPPIFSLLHERAVLRTGKEVAVVTLTNWHLGLMIAATEIPAQLLLLLFGFFENQTQQACAEKNAKGCLKASRLVLMILAPPHRRDRRTSRGKGFASTCVPYREGT